MHPQATGGPARSRPPPRLERSSAARGGCPGCQAGKFPFAVGHQAAGGSEQPRRRHSASFGLGRMFEAEGRGFDVFSRGDNQ
eukprot:scaffold124848_cov42-Prasinocladus_malaysianus.AAC.1